MHGAQRSGNQNGQHRCICNRPPLVYHYGRWSSPPSISPRGFVEDGTLVTFLMGPGGIDTILACRGVLKFAVVFFVRKGVVWIFIAIVFGIVPVVSQAIFRVFHFPTSHLTCRSSVVWTSVVFCVIYRLWMRNVDLALFFPKY